MQARRLLILSGGAAAVVVLFLLLRPGGDDEEAAPGTTQSQATTSAKTETETPPPKKPEVAVIRITIRGAKPVGGIERPKVKKGRRVRFVVRSDVADHIHVHGYDLMRDVAPGKPARIAFRATVPGRFEVELEDRGLQIAELEVRP